MKNYTINIEDCKGWVTVKAPLKYLSYFVDEFAGYTHLVSAADDSFTLRITRKYEDVVNRFDMFFFGV